MQTIISNTSNLTNAEATADIFLLAYQALPAESQQIISNRIRMNEFWENRPGSELARLQDVAPLENIDDLSSGFWPTDDSIDEMLDAIRSWREASITSIAHSEDA